MVGEPDANCARLPLARHSRQKEGKLHEAPIMIRIANCLNERTPMVNDNKTNDVAALSDLHTGLHKCIGLDFEHNIFCC